MKKIYHNFITKKEAEEQVEIGACRSVIVNTDNKLVEKIVNKLKEDFDFNISEKSYWSIESRSRGHKWHKDTGSKNHMAWCQVGVSLLLEEADSGGNTYYSDNPSGSNSIKVERGLYDLIAHTSDEWHMVEPHEGKRIVFLMFI